MLQLISNLQCNISQHANYAPNARHFKAHYGIPSQQRAATPHTVSWIHGEGEVPKLLFYWEKNYGKIFLTLSPRLFSAY